MSAEAKLQLKLKKKLRTAVRKSNEVGTENAVNNGRSSSKDDKVSRRERTSIKEMKSNSGEGDRQSKPTTSDRRKKRIYAARESEVGERLQDETEALERKSSSKRVQKRPNDNSLQVKGSSKSTRTMWLSGRGDDTKDSFRKTKKLEKTVDFSSLKLKTNKKDVGKKDCSGVDFLKKQRKGKSDTNKHSSQLKEKQMVPSSSRPTRKKGMETKTTNDDLKLKDEQPKRRKRIRLDPYDTSNKRLDDCIPINENTKENRPETGKNGEMSKNAQFRAIQPSPSILSFVEENLLGRRRTIELRRAGYNVDLSAPLDNIPLSTGSEREKIEETVFRNKLSFFAAAKVSSSFPPPDLPEIAFAGRSNVGKSSLLNALTRQWGVVRTSDKPGLTQTINFFKLGSKLCLVDLPGYGFAYAKEEVKDAWEELVKEYVSSRIGLKRVCLLIDTKWGMKPRDHELIDLMERCQTKYQVVLTKTDLMFPIDVARRAMQIEESLRAKKSVIQPVMMVSSKSGAGIRSLRTVLAKIARFAKV